jgi:hypothetical protein
MLIFIRWSIEFEEKNFEKLLRAIETCTQLLITCIGE